MRANNAYLIPNSTEIIFKEHKAVKMEFMK